MAYQLAVDLYGCCIEKLNDLEEIRRIAKETVKQIGAEIVEECCHCFQPIGITYLAVITTSHFSIHTWPEYGYVAVDVFSCSEAVPGEVAAILEQAFGATEMRCHEWVREVGPRPRTLLNHHEKKGRKEEE